MYQTGETGKIAGNRIEDILRGKRMDISQKLKDFQMCFDNSPLAFFIIQVQKGEDEVPEGFSFCYINQAFEELVERKKETLQNIYFLGKGSLEQKKWLDFYAKTAFEGKEQVTVKYKNDIRKYINSKCYQIAEGFCASALINITEQKSAEKNLKESRLKYEIAMQNSDISVWEYDILKDSLLLSENAQKIHGWGSYLSDFSKIAVENGLIHIKSYDEFSRLLQELKEGKENTQADIWIRSVDGFDWWCERIVFVTSFDENGNPDRAYGTGRNVTKEKNTESKYYELKAMKDIEAQRAITSYRINLTKNILEECFGIAGEFLNDKSASADVLFEEAKSYIIDAEGQSRYGEVFKREKLIEEYENGNSEYSIQVRYRRKRKQSNWIEITLHVMANPVSGDVIAFVYLTNIQEEKIKQLLVKDIVKTGFDFVACIFIYENSYTIYESANGYSAMPPISSENYEEMVYQVGHTFVHPDDSEMCIANMKVEHIREELEEKEVYELVVRTIEYDGSLTVKKQLFSYLDEEKEIILHIRIDITEAVREQETVNQKLMEALKLEEQASKTKTNFLTNMSHEIRTPMNAIIGLGEIARTSVNNAEVVKECIDKSMDSAHYLLALINDILDMSRIERGKIVLEGEKFELDTLLDGVNTIITPLAEQAEVYYSYFTDKNCSRFYYGDIIRIKQILVNFLNNAVKFTQSGGKVIFKLKKENSQREQDFLKFTIKDTGIGIGEEFLPKIFETFSQEYGESNTQYGGSGLGLAISKNLIELMGGNVEVESMVGIGTTFEVTLKLKRAAESETAAGKERVEETYCFDGKRVLLVEDHPLNTVVAQNLLEKVGFEVESAKNGKAGVEAFETSKEGYFNAILMDIRMPVMDGIEATVTIRNLLREDAKKIPIIAMTANAFAEDIEKSKEAGINVHLVKPIDPHLLYRTLAQQLQKEEH